eukprot:comp18833_c1_seq1/m.20832 comp18833_c1_seq1/g.20832  ORF comp18833_c1_seq1/g.20832 comp18833_c1_seq1/m.20832 type:complete len:303 (-) comp18833_c1_seq1:78-986(-)
MAAGKDSNAAIAQAQMRRTGADLLGGTVGGIFQALVGHPLDTIKVRLQNQGNKVIYKGTVDCFRQTVQKEGFLGLYKGLSSPLVMAGFLNAVVFGVNGGIKRIIGYASNTPPNQLSTPQLVLCAWGTAPIYAAVLNPVDVVKNRLQIQSAGAEKLYNGPIDCLAKTLKADGVKGLMRGYSATCMTRVVGMPFYFTSYELVRRSFIPPGGTKDDIKTQHTLIAGATAGITFWGANYPIDFAKTRMQTRREGNAGLWGTMRQVVATEGGILALYRGFTPCIMRAGPANAVTFLGLEITLRALGY